MVIVIMTFYYSYFVWCYPFLVHWIIYLASSDVYILGVQLAQVAASIIVSIILPWTTRPVQVADCMH